MKADLHVHSKYSTRPSQWILQKIGCPESFTEPGKIYEIAIEKGMSLVTIADHNTIEGALEIAHLPKAFVSEEVTTYFPEDGCKVHVLVFDINEKQHQDIQKARPSIFDLVPYLHAEKIVHALAHPLYSTNDRLTVEHFEQLLLLFKNLELNGARDALHDEVLKWIVAHLRESDIDRLAQKHGITPQFQEPWRKNLTGGSDDHSSLNIARKYTKVQGAGSLQEFLRGIETGQSTSCGNSSTPLTMAHNFYSIAYKFYMSKFNLERHVHRDMFLCFLDRLLNGNDRHTGIFSKLHFLWRHHTRQKNGNQGRSLQEMLKHESHELIWKDPQLMEIVNHGNGKGDDNDVKWFEFVDHVSNKVMAHFSNHFLDHLSGANFLDLFTSLGSAGALYSIFAPYFVSFSLFANERKLASEIALRLPSHLNPRKTKSPAKVAHFTDTFSEINGVALTIRQQVELAKKSGKDYTVITCAGDEAESLPEVKYFSPIAVHQLPEYSELKLYSPPFLEMLRFCFEQGFTHIHSATPGPIGLVALVISRILKLPITGTYHTALPQYAGYLTDDNSIEDLMWKYVLWYYAQLDWIYVPSMSTGNELARKGLSQERLRLFPRGIDIQRFHPSNRDPDFIEAYAEKSSLKMLYVGRVSKEKELPLLVEVYKALRKDMKNLSLIVVGDGPYLETMKQELKGMPCSFTGYLKDERLEKIYASSDLFVFPSTTDTFGNVVLEAQSSGIPVVVTDKGGPQENIIPGKTGLVVPANDGPAMLEAVYTLLMEPERLTVMGKAARSYMEDRSFEKAFNETWNMYNQEDAGMTNGWISEPSIGERTFSIGLAVNSDIISPYRPPQKR